MAPANHACGAVVTGISSFCERAFCIAVLCASPPERKIGCLMVSRPASAATFSAEAEMTPARTAERSAPDAMRPMISDSAKTAQVLVIFMGSVFLMSLSRSAKFSFSV